MYVYFLAVTSMTCTSRSAWETFPRWAKPAVSNMIRKCFASIC